MALISRWKLDKTSGLTVVDSVSGPNDYKII